ncbi:MAG: GlxA family transcriptional regulator, partial [Gammaproteobacteria bacterium]
DASVPQACLRVAVLALPDAAPATLYGMVELLDSVGTHWGLMTGTPPRPGLTRTQVVAADTAPFTTSVGIWLRPDACFDDAPPPDVVCVPALTLDVRAPSFDTPAYRRSIGWLRHCHDAGAMICSVCSGSLLLAEAGLLDGGEATTHWGYADIFRRRYPRVRLHAERVLVATGPGHRLLTAGGAASQNDLMLYLVARFFGAEEAMRVARVHLLQWHPEGQQPYACLTGTQAPDDQLIGACLRWAAKHYATPNPVAAMVAMSGLPERSFKRRFRRATGHAPLDYVQNLRIETAKHLLETTEEPLDGISARVGYEDPAFLRRLFVRRVGLSPAQYRRRFSPAPLLRAAAR